jgi:hypothetical protein
MSKFLQHCRRHTATCLAVGLALAAPSAWAALTGAGTEISNDASVSYSVNNVPQTAASNKVKFTVDNLVRVVVSESGNSATSVTPGATGQVLTFTVTNTGNATQDYILTSISTVAKDQTLALGSPSTIYTDAFNPTSCQAYVESKPVADGYDASDTATSISSLAADQSKTVYVVCSIPIDQANGTDALAALVATTANSGSCATTCAATVETTGADTAGIDVVFADVAGSDDSNRDGKHSARDAFRVTSASLSISKTVTLVCDPFNFAGNGSTVYPKNVPGAYVQYAITVSNAAGSGQSAKLTTITDQLPAGALAFDPDLRTGSSSACATSNPESAAGRGFKLTCTGGTRACVGTPVFYTGVVDAPNPDAIEVSTCSGKPCVTITAGDTPTGAKVLGTEAGQGYAAGELKPGESITIHFNAIIQ